MKHIKGTGKMGIKHKRNDYVDIYKFVMAIGILFFHSYHLDNITNNPFQRGQIFLKHIFF